MLENEPYDRLEAELLRLLSEGTQPAETAEKLELGEHTVQIMTARLLIKMNCRTIAEAVAQFNSNNVDEGQPGKNT